jgi:hypothetical protein
MVGGSITPPDCPVCSRRYERYGELIDSVKRALEECQCPVLFEASDFLIALLEEERQECNHFDDETGKLLEINADAIESAR